jgi:hypothetical protein
MGLVPPVGMLGSEHLPCRVNPVLVAAVKSRLLEDRTMLAIDAGKARAFTRNGYD